MTQDKKENGGPLRRPGEVAQKYGIPTGTIGCPHCGAVVHGAIDKPICEACDKPYWDKESCDES